MRAKVTKIDLTQIDEREAQELLNELHKMDIVFHTDKYPRLYELEQILKGLFSSSITGVHYVSKRGE